MRLIIDFDKFQTTFKQIESIMKQDKTLKSETKTVVIYIGGTESSSEKDIPVFFRTKSIQMCQPLYCQDVENSDDSMSIELNVTEIISILNSFKSTLTPPSQVQIEFTYGSPNIMFTVFVPQESSIKGNAPINYFFNLKHTTPPSYIMEEFLSDMSNSEIKYSNVSLSDLTAPLKALSEGYKYIPSHITSQIYVRFNREYIYMRTAMGMIAYKNPTPVLQDINLLEDSVKILGLVALSFSAVNLYNDEKRAKLYIQTGLGGGTIIFNYRTSYNEDDSLKGIFKLISSKETITLSRQAFEQNFKRIPDDSSILYFTRTRGTGKILCDISSRVMQSLMILNQIGYLVDQMVLKLKPIMIRSALVPLTSSKSEILRMHFGTQDHKTVTIAFTDDTNSWYSLISVSAIFGEDYYKTVQEYEKFKF